MATYWAMGHLSMTILLEQRGSSFLSIHQLPDTHLMLLTAHPYLCWDGEVLILHKYHGCWAHSSASATPRPEGSISQCPPSHPVTPSQCFLSLPGGGFIKMSHLGLSSQSPLSLAF